MSSIKSRDQNSAPIVAVNLTPHQGWRTRIKDYTDPRLDARQPVKEQMNKRKPDDEFAKINLSFTTAKGEDVVVWCPESKDALATQQPARRRLNGQPEAEAAAPAPVPVPVSVAVVPDVVPTAPVESATAAPPQPILEPLNPPAPSGPGEQHFTIMYGASGYSYESIVGPYLQGAKAVTIEDPYIRLQHQIQNFVRFCETVVRAGSVRRITLITGHDERTPLAEMAEKLEELKQSLLEVDVELDVKLNPNIHDREIRIDNGWIVKIGRGLDFYQKPNGWFEIGANDMSLRKCLETKVDIYRRLSE